MGSTQSMQEVEDEEGSNGEEEEEEEEEEDDQDHGDRSRNEMGNLLVRKVLEQEPEMLPYYSSASPLSPQLSSLGTPRLGPSIKVWDPFNVLAPPPSLPPPPSVFSSGMGGASSAIDDDWMVTEVFLISHGECELNLRPDLVGGRCHEAALTPNGKREARALAVFLNSKGVRFNAVYTSPLDRARAMAVSVCQEMNFAEEQIQSSDELMEMSMGHWEGCLQSETFTPEISSLRERYQPDFAAPSGESLRQVEFRMAQFLNGTILGFPEKLRSSFTSPHQNESQKYQHSSHSLTNSIHDQPNWDLQYRQRHLSRKTSGKSRLQAVTTTGEQHEADNEMSSLSKEVHDLNTTRPSSSYMSSSCVGVFTHSVPIKCLLTGVLGCSPVMAHKFCIEESSVTVIQHSWKTGWQIKRLNDTAHLRLL